MKSQLANGSAKKGSVLAEYLRLRLLIGYLGESAQYGWWQTSFFQPSSKAFLEPVFPKTIQLAQYHGVREAARRLHDEHVGVGNAFHLFRLPEEAEQDLHKMVEARLADASLLAEVADKQMALGALSSLASGEGAAPEGPAAVGRLDDLLRPKSVKEVARYYLAAFNQGVRTYPYFAG